MTYNKKTNDEILEWVDDLMNKEASISGRIYLSDEERDYFASLCERISVNIDKSRDLTIDT